MPPFGRRDGIGMRLRGDFPRVDRLLGHRVSLDCRARHCGRVALRRGPDHRTLCIACAIDDGDPQIWVPGDPLPQELLAADEIVSHNFAFERAMATRILTTRHGWPTIPLAKQRCSMTLALACALPAALDKAAKVLGLPYEKDAEGYRLMRRMSRPRRPHKNEDPSKTYWVDGPEQREQLHHYCMRDVETER